MVKCVVFDFDGTLVESNEIKRKTFYEVTKDIDGADLILDKLFSRPGLGDRHNIFNSLIEILKKTNNSDINPTYLSDLYTNICEDKISKAPEVIGALGTLKELNKRNFKIFVSSATPVNTLKRIIRMRGWVELFEDVMGAPESKEDHLKSILSLKNYSVSEVVYVGDSEIDQKAALSTGCGFIGVGKNWNRFGSKPSVLLSTLENLTKELKV
jgi:phosphoglycolate phosphatase